MIIKRTFDILSGRHGNWAPERASWLVTNAVKNYLTKYRDTIRVWTSWRVDCCSMQSITGRARSPKSISCPAERAFLKPQTQMGSSSSSQYFLSEMQPNSFKVDCYHSRTTKEIFLITWCFVSGHEAKPRIANTSFLYFTITMSMITRRHNGEHRLMQKYTKARRGAAVLDRDAWVTWLQLGLPRLICSFDDTLQILFPFQHPLITAFTLHY